MQNRPPEKTVHDIVKHKLTKGPSNMGHSHPVLFELSTFGRLIADYMFKKVEHTFSLDQKIHKMELHLLDHACHALMGEVYETGSCGQHASIALLEYLKQGVDKPVEYIQFFGMSHDNHETNHAVVTTGRNADYSKDVNKWGKFYVIDTWANNSFNYPDKDPTNGTPLGYPKQFYSFFKSIDGLYFNCRFEKNITSQQWQKLAEFFKFLSNFTEDDFNKFLKMRSSKVNSSNELSLIHKKIQEYIAVFSHLAAHPHLDKINSTQNKQKPLLQKKCAATNSKSETTTTSLASIRSVEYQVGIFQPISEKNELPHGLSNEMIKEGADALGKALSSKPLPTI